MHMAAQLTIVFRFGVSRFGSDACFFAVVALAVARPFLAIGLEDFVLVLEDRVCALQLSDLVVTNHRLTEDSHFAKLFDRVAGRCLH
jgi:hypothetical protein